MSRSPRFTVLLPTHERPDVLGFAIAGVLRQTEPDFELFVVADGCQPSTAALVRAFNDPRIRLFDLPKAPHFGYESRALALAHASGRFVAYAAHDDLLFPDHLARVGAMLEAGADWAYTRPLWVSTDGIVMPSATNLLLGDEREAFVSERNTLPLQCVAHTRALYDAVGGWPTDVPAAADWLLWRRMVAWPGCRIDASTVPTGLHFSAIWRRSRHGGPPEIAALLAIADTAPWWPDALRLPVAPGVPEQAAFADAITRHGLDWCGAVRAAADVALWRLGWDAVRGRAERTVAPMPALPATSWTPDLGLFLIVNGKPVTAFERRGDVSRFRCTAPITTLRLRSNHAPPEDRGGGADVRRLGVAVQRLRFRSAAAALDFGPDDVVFGYGFHASETTIRWSDGDGTLLADALRGLDGDVMVEVWCAGLDRYRWLG